MDSKSFRTVDEYIGQFPENIQTILQKIRTTIQHIASGSEETISYGMPTYKLNGKNMVHFAAFTHHIGFYPTPSAVDAYHKEISQYKSAKGSIQFPLDKPIPYDLIKQITEFRKSELEK